MAFLEVNIQPYRGWEGWAAPRRQHVWCVCLRVRLFPVPSSSTSQKAAAQVAAHPAFAVREVVRVPGLVVSHRSLRIPDGTSCRPVRVQVAARTAAGVCGSCVSLFGGWGKTDETSTRSTGTGGGAGCCRGAGGGSSGLLVLARQHRGALGHPLRLLHMSVQPMLVLTLGLSALALRCHRAPQARGVGTWHARVGIGLTVAGAGRVAAGRVHVYCVLPPRPGAMMHLAHVGIGLRAFGSS